MLSYSVKHFAKKASLNLHSCGLGPLLASAICWDMIIEALNRPFKLQVLSLSPVHTIEDNNYVAELALAKRCNVTVMPIFFLEGGPVDYCGFVAQRKRLHFSTVITVGCFHKPGPSSGRFSLICSRIIRLSAISLAPGHVTLSACAQWTRLKSRIFLVQCALFSDHLLVYNLSPCAR